MATPSIPDAASIIALRKHWKLTRRQFGRAVGYPREYIERVEQGQTIPSPGFLARLTLLYGPGET